MPEIGTLAVSVSVEMGGQGPGGVGVWQSLLNMSENQLKRCECVSGLHGPLPMQAESEAVFDKIKCIQGGMAMD